MSVGHESVYFNQAYTVTYDRKTFISTLLQKIDQYQEHHHRERNQNETRGRDQYRPDLNRVSIRELRHHKETNNDAGYN